MFRYREIIGRGGVFENPEGEFVKLEDVIALIDELPSMLCDHNGPCISSEELKEKLK